MKKILCPVDFSDASRNAIAYTGKLAKASGAAITLLNVLSPLKSGAIFNSEKKTLHLTVSQELEAISREVGQVYKVACDSEVLETEHSLIKTISYKAKEYDLIVMGTHGVADLYEFLTGSHTYHVILDSKIAVLLIPYPFMYCEIKSIVYAYSYLRERKLPLTQLIEWSQALKSDVTILQVNEEAISEDVIEEMEDWQFILSQHWGKKGVHLTFDSIRSAEIAPSVNSYIHRNESDVLALCTSNENFIKGLFKERVIKVISEIADYPVFVFHE